MTPEELAEIVVRCLRCWWCGAFTLEDETASDFVYSLGRFGSNLIAGIDIEVGSWVVSSRNVHCGRTTRLHSTWLFSLEALQLCAVGSSSTSLAMHQVLQLPSLLFPSESLSVWFGRGEPRPRVVHRRSCSFVEAGRLVYMSLVIRVTSASVRLCFGRCGSCTSLTIRRVACSSVAGGAAIATAHVSTVERGLLLLGWVFVLYVLYSFTFRYHSLNNYFCCPFLS